MTDEFYKDLNAAIKAAPKRIYLRVCPSCGRSDLTYPLPVKHYSRGKECPGGPRIITLGYDPVGRVRSS